MNANTTELIRQLVSEGIEVTLKLERVTPKTDPQDNTMIADLNSGTKSGMYLIEDQNGVAVVTGRYGERDEVTSLDDLLDVFVSRYFARDFGSDVWIAAAARHNKMRVRVVTTEVVERV